MYQISANLVHRELINATHEGKKMPTSIRMPDSGSDKKRNPNVHSIFVFICQDCLLACILTKSIQ